MEEGNLGLGTALEGRKKTSSLKANCHEFFTLMVIPRKENSLVEHWSKKQSGSPLLYMLEINFR